MAMREDKAELRARVYLLEKERSALELKLSSQEAHQAAQEATVQHLQAQLQDIERRLQAQHQQVSMLLQFFVCSGYIGRLNFRKIQTMDLIDTDVR
jgi:septal ring factor EnvC (AmiA/AmiB activator)